MAVLDAHEMLLKGARMAGESSSDTDLLALWSEPFLSGINAANIDFVRLFKVKVREAVTLDANSKFTLSGLAQDVDTILAVYEDDDERSEAYKPDINGDSVFVEEAAGGQTVYVQYRPLPALLVNTYPVDAEGHTAGSDATAPSYIPEQHQDCMIYKGLAEVYSMLRDDDAVGYWETKYFQAKSNIRAPGRQTHVRASSDY